MKSPILFTTSEEIEHIRKHIHTHAWYRAAYEKIKWQADALLQKGTAVPQQSGFVFYDCCERDNQKLVFDPYTPFMAYCPQCGMRYDDAPHRRAWILHQHNWLSQMAVLVGITYQIEQDEKYAVLLHGILMNYAKVYPSFPNNDNELGPTKFAQSTYMESVFILYFSVAYDMVRQSNAFSAQDHAELEKSFFRPSVEAILDYDEKLNNRQAFNNAGILAVGYLLGDAALVDYALNGPHGFVFHMENSVLSDGMWYEGDNYHFATVPSLVSIAEMCLRNGLDFYHKTFTGKHGRVSIEDMFLTPLQSLQPDLTFPSRKDSPYANFFAQRWYTGLYELAYTRYQNPAISTALNLAYSQTARDAMDSAAGVMDVFAPAPANRSEMDFRGFLLATPHLPEDGRAFAESRLFDGTGLAVVKRQNGDYFSVDYGDYGGGHGHPDRLNINYFVKGKRWISDFGTGSYYFDHLHYYRSSISHNVLIVDGKDHMEKDGRCTHFFDDRSVALVHTTVSDIAPGVVYSRTNLVLDGLLLDIATAESIVPHTYHHALHPVSALECTYPSSPVALVGDGYGFLENVRQLQAEGQVTLLAKDENETLTIAHADCDACYVAQAYGPPVHIPQKFPVVLFEKTGNCATFVTCFDSSGTAKQTAVSVSETGNIHIAAADGRVLHLQRTTNPTGEPAWVLDNTDAGGTTSRYLFGADPASCGAAQTHTTLTNKAGQWLSSPKIKSVETVVFALPSGLRLECNNPTDMPAKISIEGQAQTIPALARAAFTVPTANLFHNIQQNKLSLEYAIDAGKGFEMLVWEKPIFCIASVACTTPVDAFAFQPNLFINRPAQIRRNEKLYNGENDLSVQAMIAENGSSFILRAKITDDVVLFGGGKFPYDNDSIQVYIDMRSSPDYDSHKSAEGVVALLVVPPINAEQTRVVPIGKTNVNTDLITAGLTETPDGYEVLLVIAWEALGGRPPQNTLLGFDLIVNDRDSGVRRDLQGVWSGCEQGERAYLKQASHECTRFGIAYLGGQKAEGCV